MEHIPPPISDRHPLKLTDSEDCEQLIGDLADVTGWQRKAALESFSHLSQR